MIIKISKFLIPLIMKKIILFTFLILTFGCSDDEPLPTLTGVTAIETAPLSISISTMDDTNISSCPEIENASFLMKDNSIVSGAIGTYGNLDDSSDNSIIIYSCVIASNGNDNFVIQRFGGVFKTTKGEEVNLEGFIEINRTTQKVQGLITITTMDYNDKRPEHYDVAGIIKKSGSCNITGRNAG